MINRDGKIRVYSPKRCWTDLTDAEVEEIVRRKKNESKNTSM